MVGLSRRGTLLLHGLAIGSTGLSLGVFFLGPGVPLDLKVAFAGYATFVGSVAYVGWRIFRTATVGEPAPL